MFNRTALFAALTFALAFALSPHARAADQPAASAAPAFKVPEGGISPRQLGDLLTNLGYETKATHTEKGNTLYTFTSTPTGWTIKLEAVLSDDGDNLWVSVLLNMTDRMTSLDGDYFRNLLVKNFDLYPLCYQVSHDGRLYLNLPAANKDITAVALRKQIESLVASTMQMKNDWHPTHYLEAKKAAKESEKQAAK